MSFQAQIICTDSFANKITRRRATSDKIPLARAKGITNTETKLQTPGNEIIRQRVKEKLLVFVPALE